ncbi:hypothetical protein GCM10010121_007300 [Streptomyces brasiliensis]|uniref:Rieske domain-containing protein n=1 Tax=Streptomyces brasiliensis TaxID=1954 RepID=A0A917K5B8_9ACTN|nr:hypothetical protein GCM10010121_007300 [Streptomyces brasiliensis]
MTGPDDLDRWRSASLLHHRTARAGHGPDFPTACTKQVQDRVSRTERGPVIPVCRLEDLPKGESVRVDSTPPVAVFHTDEGDLCAIDDTCTHQDASLAEGWLEGCLVECPLHVASFDLRTGGTDLSPGAPLRPHPPRHRRRRRDPRPPRRRGGNGCISTMPVRHTAISATAPLMTPGAVPGTRRRPAPPETSRTA